MAIAQRHPPKVDRGDAPLWLAEQLARPQAEGVCRVVYHSMFLQYLTDRSRDAIVRSIRKAGTSATVQRPLAWITFERTKARYEVQLRLTCWPGSGTRLLARCHAYGDWIDWRT